MFGENEGRRRSQPPRAERKRLRKVFVLALVLGRRLRARFTAALARLTMRRQIMPRIRAGLGLRTRLQSSRSVMSKQHSNVFQWSKLSVEDRLSRFTQVVVGQWCIPRTRRTRERSGSGSRKGSDSLWVPHIHKACESPVPCRISGNHELHDPGGSRGVHFDSHNTALARSSNRLHLPECL